MSALGVDLSAWQLGVDFNKLAAKLGKDGFAYMRASVGFVDTTGVKQTVQDVRFSTYWPAAKAAGLRRGVYTYYHQNVSAGDQLMTLLKAVNTDWGELPPAVDVEQPVKDANGNPVVWTLTQNKDLQWFIWALGKICGKTPIIYTGVGYWNAYVLPSYSGNPTATSKDNSWASAYKLWIANWSVAAGSAPPLPQPWDKYAFHQYGKGKGSDYGAESAEIDLDIEYSTNPTPPVYPTPKFTASATSITAGQSVTLNWSNTDGANEIRLNGAAQSGPTGSAVVAPTANTTYSLFVGYPDAPSVTKQVAILVTPAPVPTTIKPAFGIHILDNVRAAEKAREAGCEVFTFMNMHLEASRWATGDPRKWFPGCGYPLIFYRQFHYTGDWSATQMIDQLGGALAHGNNNMVITLANEWDNNIQGAGTTYEGTLKFCNWTLDCMKLLEARGFNNYAVLTSSTGTPDFTKDGVCQAIKETLAPEWNKGRIRFVDMHLYGPTVGHIDKDNELIWYERRYEFLFTKCGFSATAPGFIISSELGLDVGGTGGFPANGQGREEVVRYCNRSYEIHARPIVVNGVSYPSRFLAGTLFQGSPLSWQGYDVSGYYPLPWHA